MNPQINKVIGYSKPVFLLCLFMLIIYGAYTPSQKIEAQQIVCVKFKAGASEEAKKKYTDEFAKLRREIPEMVNYHAGKTVNSTDYDVMHYISFRKESDIEVFKNHPKFKALEAANASILGKTFVILSDVEQ